MPFLDSYKNYLQIRGGNIKSSLSKHSIQQWSLLMKNSPSYYEVFINDGINPVGALIVDNSNNKDQKSISLVPGEILSCGDYVTWQGNKWLTINVDYQGDIYYRGIIFKCYSTIKWIAPDGVIHEYPFGIYADFNSIVGVQDDRIINIPNERRTIIVQSNPETQKIKKDKRFIFDNRAWKVIGVNGLYDGIIYLTLEEDLINESKDDLTLRIADYYDFVPPPSINPGIGLSIIITSNELKPEEIKITQSKTYEAKVYNNGIEETGKTVLWSLFADNQIDPTTLAQIVNVNNNFVTIKAHDKSQYGYVQLKAELSDDSSVFSWFRIKIRSLI